jgi:hypothetical protein
MHDSPTICICGGGNIAHSLAFAFSAFTDVSVLTQRPSEWNSHLRGELGSSHVQQESLYSIHATSDVSIVSRSDVVIVALPRFAIQSILNRIREVMYPGQTVVFIPAPANIGRIEDFVARNIDVIGFQRVPYVARIIEYGKSVWISDVRKEHRLAFSRQSIATRWSEFFTKCFGGEIRRLSSFWSFIFSNSNPLLHPARLVPLLYGGDEGRYTRCPYFYAEWTDESSELYVDADKEMYNVFVAYAPQSAKDDYESALAHYEVNTSEELTRKIRSIKSLQPILAPWRENEIGLWLPDFNSRYFSEDIPFGTKVIQDYALKKGIDTPVIDSLISRIESWSGSAMPSGN